ncbi:hypothetical protein NKI56_32115 [Mesorhizobium sp. M0622]|uniref:hypothetical protein n=1 Tax=Mesorhizobium sp. M0622 TaxID=2956975 RepID=UPI00333622B5
MADQNSHTILTKGDKYYAASAPKRASEMPLTNEPWRSELREAHQRDLELHRETQAKQQRIKADGAPHVLVALAGENTEVRDYLIGLVAARSLEGK